MASAQHCHFMTTRCQCLRDVLNMDRVASSMWYVVEQANQYFEGVGFRSSQEISPSTLLAGSACERAAIWRAERNNSPSEMPSRHKPIVPNISGIVIPARC